MYREGGMGRDTLTGGNGWDELYGNGGNDLLRGQGGQDVLFGDAGADSLYGGLDDDYLDGGAGNDLIDGGAGVDAVGYEFAASAVTVNLSITTAQNTGAEGWDRLISIENLAGSAFGDLLIGNAGDNGIAGHDGNDTIQAGDGDDWLEGGAGDDSIDGGAGIDTISFANTVFAGTGTGGVMISLIWNPPPLPSFPGEGHDTVVGVENVIGSARDDLIQGDRQDNYLAGKDGDDALDGRGGNDVLEGGAGNDRLTINPNWNDQIVTHSVLDGGDGNDSFIVKAGGVEVLGGEGLDTLLIGDFIGSWSARAQYDGLTVDLAAPGPQQIHASHRMTISSIENLTTGDGNDTIYASEARNVIAGGGNSGGGDRLIYRSLDEIGLGATSDRLSGIEFIDMTLIDADVTQAGKQSFRLLAEGQSFTGRAGEAMFVSAWDDKPYPYPLPTKDSVMKFDVDGDGLADAEIAVYFTTSAADFVF